MANFKGYIPEQEKFATLFLAMKSSENQVISVKICVISAIRVLSFQSLVVILSTYRITIRYEICIKLFIQVLF